eukprot:GEZU01027629.1.p1 GENE.GEZU01027629.1~~GEZU01027629.1.p1  ORF type:complete len:162 (-),score=8.31 GEZU01027629.1:1046-1531(-)
MTRSSFEYWTTHVAVPGVEELRRKNKLSANTHGMILVDGHSSRDDPAALRLFKAHSIKLFKFRPNMTLGVQPLDCYGLKAYKAEFRKVFPLLKREWEKWNEDQQKSNCMLRASLLRCALIDAGINAWTSPPFTEERVPSVSCSRVSSHGSLQPGVEFHPSN